MGGGVVCYKQHPQFGVVLRVKHSPRWLRGLLGAELLLPVTPVGGGLGESSWNCDCVGKKNSSLDVK